MKKLIRSPIFIFVFILTLIMFLDNRFNLFYFNKKYLIFLLTYSFAFFLFREAMSSLKIYKKSVINKKISNRNVYDIDNKIVPEKVINKNDVDEANPDAITILDGDSSDKIETIINPQRKEIVVAKAELYKSIMFFALSLFFVLEPTLLDLVSKIK